MTRVLAYGIAALTALAAAYPAQAQNKCGARPDLVRELAQSYEERSIGIGWDNRGGVVEVFSSSDGATWTIVVTLPNGMSCLIAAGQHWEGPQQPAVADSPT